MIAKDNNMNGSEKQIKWASEIVQDWIRKIDLFAEEAQARIANGSMPQIWLDTVLSVSEEGKNRINAIDDASWIIVNKSLDMPKMVWDQIVKVYEDTHKEIEADCDVAKYEETEQAEVDGAIDETLIGGYTRWYGYGTYQGKACRCEYITSPADDRTAEESGDLGAIDWEDRIVEIMLADSDGGYDTEECVSMDNKDYIAGQE